MIRLLILFIFLFPEGAFAEKQVYGDWVVDWYEGDEEILAFAFSSNDSGSVLGVMCISSNEECMPYLVNGLGCDEGDGYPALVGTEDGITAVNMICFHLGTNYLYTLPASHLEYIVTNNNYSLAFGVESGKFKAAYFSLNGSAKAVLAAKTVIEVKRKNSNNKVKPNAYRDELL